VLHNVFFPLRTRGIASSVFSLFFSGAPDLSDRLCLLSSDFLVLLALHPAPRLARVRAVLRKS
jgi:hypothetical protein